MKITYKELKCNKNSSKYTTVIRCIRRYLPVVELIAVRDISRICKDTYRVIADLEIHNISVRNAVFQIVIPRDMRKKIILTPLYSKDERYTEVSKTVDDEDIILSIKEYCCVDILDSEISNDIVIREETVRFRVKPRERVFTDYYSLYIDNEGIIRLHNSDSIRDDITYIYAAVDIGHKPTLYPGYIKKSLYCTALIDYKKADCITINRLVHNVRSTRYCKRYRDVIYMPESYMNYVRGLLGIKKWG